MKVRIFEEVLPAVLLAVLVAALVAAGCAPASTSAGDAPAAGSAEKKMAEMKCGPCKSKAAGVAEPLQAGEVSVENGVQVIRISIDNEHYVPNDFEVKADMPLRIEFTGQAAGCLGAPTFPALDKRVELESGSGIADLGKLPAGTYELTCGMSSSAGRIVAK